jgi:hypothetical protein
MPEGFGQAVLSMPTIRKTVFFLVQSIVSFCTNNMVCCLYLSNMWYRAGHGGMVVLLGGSCSLKRNE